MSLQTYVYARSIKRERRKIEDLYNKKKITLSINNFYFLPEPGRMF